MCCFLEHSMYMNRDAYVYTWPGFYADDFMRNEICGMYSDKLL